MPSPCCASKVRASPSLKSSRTFHDPDGVDVAAPRASCEQSLSSPDVLASPFPGAGTAAARPTLPGRSSYGTSAGGAVLWKPCHDLRRGLARGPLARGHAACYARQAGFLQDAKPEQGVPRTGATFSTRQPHPPSPRPSRVTGSRQQQRPPLALHACLGGHEGMDCRLLHRRAAPVEPLPREEAAPCSHLQPYRQSAFPA